MKKKMNSDEIMYVLDQLHVYDKGERGRFIRSQGWRVGDFENELVRRLMAGELHRDTYKPVIRPEIIAKYGVDTQ